MGSGRMRQIDVALDLGGLTEPLTAGSMDAAAAEAGARVAAFKAKYGPDWSKHYVADVARRRGRDEDAYQLEINSTIWEHSCYMPGDGFGRKVMARMRFLYGDDYDELSACGPRDPRVGELLVNDAIRTGKWRHLPEELQCLYHAKVGDGT